MNEQLPKTFDHAAVEPRLYAAWEKAGVFHEEPDPARPAFVIAMPPPNITGRAHLGHGSTYTPMDVLTRYHRMLGENATWLPGQDHAAIATESVLVRELAKEGHTRQSLGRERYLERAWQWREEYGGAINHAFRQLGFGPDWPRERFTMDPGLSAAVIKVFVALYEEGLIYRGTRLINWDPQAQSTLSDAEIDYEEREGFLWHVRYRGQDGSDGVVVATTRPETMLGDTAVAVHPEDERYRHLIGKNVILPLMDRPIPVVADAAVERDFGTGAVKVTPAHDPLDNEIGERHGLPAPSVIGFDGTMTGDVGSYAGLDRFEARRRIVADLEACGALIKTEPHTHRVALSSRSGAVIEPLLSLQWFLRAKPLAEPALRAYRNGAIRFVPERFGRTYEQWLENIRDWNISRQVWWGHQLPVWYTPDGSVVVAPTEEAALEQARERFGTSELRRDPDTLDTWFSSGLWPFSILGWPEQTPELQHWYPTSVLITGREIIFLWVARMVMFGLKFLGEVPFHDVFIAPLVFDAKGRKMSKSLGNAIDPIDLIAKYGADATRLGIMLQMHLESQELRFTEQRCEDARRFNNKIWNAAQYILNLPEGVPGPNVLPRRESLALADRWILTRLAATIREVSSALDRYEFGVAADLLWKFLWYEFCDWYIEATKLPSESRGAVLSFVFNNALRLLHPIEPFITEELWLHLPHDGVTIVTASWPDPAEIPVDPEAAALYERLMKVVERARAFRAEMNVPPKVRLTLEVPAGLGADVQALLGVHAHADIAVLPAANGSTGDEDLLGRVVVRAPEGILRQRYVRDSERLREEVQRLEQKLGSEAFVNKAPADVVQKERAKLQGYRDELTRVSAALAELESTA